MKSWELKHLVAESLRRVFRFSLSPLFEGIPVEVEAFEVNEISSVANIHLEQIKHNYAHLSNILFSDVSRNKEILEIDILCGSNFLWSFQDGECIRGGQVSQLLFQHLLVGYFQDLSRVRQLIFLSLQISIFVLTIFLLRSRRQN